MSFSLSVCVLYVFMFMHVHAIMPVVHTWRAEEACGTVVDGDRTQVIRFAGKCLSS